LEVEDTGGEQELQRASIKKKSAQKKDHHQGKAVGELGLKKIQKAQIGIGSPGVAKKRMCERLVKQAKEQKQNRGWKEISE